MNKFQTIDDKDLSNVVGGNKWGKAFTGAVSFGATTLKLCGKHFGLKVGAACGVAGAIVGGLAGYHD